MGRQRSSDAAGGAPPPPPREEDRTRAGDHPIPRDTPATVALAPVVKLIYVQLPGNTASGDPNGPVGRVEFWVQEGTTRRPARGEALPHTYANGSIELRPQASQELHLLQTTYRVRPIDSLQPHNRDAGAQQRLAALGYEGLHPDTPLLELLRLQLDHGLKPTGMFVQHRPGEDDPAYGGIDDAFRQLGTSFPITSS